jgi:hypothetical protein
MPSIPKSADDFGLKSTLADIASFSKKEDAIRASKTGSKEEYDAQIEFDNLIHNLMEFKRSIKKPAVFKGMASKKLDKELLHKIEKAIKFFESTEAGEQVRILKGTLFWEKLFGFQTLLQNLQDTRLKRGRKVEKVEKSGTSKKK